MIDGGFAKPPKVDMPTIVVCAALRHRDGTVILGLRHFDRFMRLTINRLGGVEEWERAEQGFVDQVGNFLTRSEALVVAREANQIRRRVGGDSNALYSENLY